MSNAAKVMMRLPNLAPRTDPVTGACVVIVTVKLALALPLPRTVGMEKDVGEKLHAAFAGTPEQANCAVKEGM